MTMVFHNVTSIIAVQSLHMSRLDQTNQEEEMVEHSVQSVS